MLKMSHGLKAKMSNEQMEYVQKRINLKFVHIHGHNRKIVTSPNLTFYHPLVARINTYQPYF
jgi:hypothetical protein